MYAINLDEEGRILRATFEEFKDDQSILVDTIPDGDITEYKYTDGSFVHDPLTVEAITEEPTAEEDALNMLIDHEERLINLELGMTE